jgi:hypothetical protein
MSENQSFGFLKIAGYGSIIPTPYLLVFPSKKRRLDSVVLAIFFSKWQKFRILKVFNCQI